MKNSKKIIYFECENEETYYVVQSPNLIFGHSKKEAIVFDSYEDLIATLIQLKNITFPYPKMIVDDL